MSSEEWEISTKVIEISDPYWDEISGGPNVYHRLAEDNESSYIDWLAKSGWELINIVPAKPIHGLPDQYKTVGNRDNNELSWNTYIGFFKRKRRKAKRPARH